MWASPRLSASRPPRLPTFDDARVSLGSTHRSSDAMRSSVTSWLPIATTVESSDSTGRRSSISTCFPGVHALAEPRNRDDSVGSHERHHHPRATLYRRRNRPLPNTPKPNAQELVLAQRGVYLPAHDGLSSVHAVVPVSPTCARSGDGGTSRTSPPPTPGSPGMPITGLDLMTPSTSG